LNGGVKAGDKEQIYTLIDSLEIDNFDDPKMHWNNFTIFEETYKDSETGEESHTRYILDSHLSDSQSHLSSNLNSSSEYAKYRWKEYKSFSSFQEFLDWVPYDSSDETKGINALLKKIDIASKWYTEYWGLYLYTIRREVDYRQKHVNEYVHSDECIIYDYQ
jgi:hypothetical protein